MEGGRPKGQNDTSSVPGRTRKREVAAEDGWLALPGPPTLHLQRKRGD